MPAKTYCGKSWIWLAAKEENIIKNYKKKITEFTSDKKVLKIISILAGFLFCIMLLFRFTEYTFGFFDRLFYFYPRTTFGLLIVAYLFFLWLAQRSNNAQVEDNTDLRNHIEVYAQLSEILFFVLRDYAPEFSMVPPRDIIDIQEKNMVIEKYGVSFYQLKCDKADLIHSFTQSELDSIKSRLQRRIDLDIKDGRFTTVDINSIFIVDTLSDYNYNFGLQIVIPDDNYYKYKQLLDIRKKTYGRREDLTESWDDN